MDIPKIGILLSVGWLLIGLPVIGEGSTAPAVWEDAVGEGFRKGAWHAGVSLGHGFGTTLGSGGLHDLLLGTAHLGRTVGGVMGRDRWYRGNWDLVGELFGGRQISPEKAQVVGLTPVLRYHFAMGTRWIPFFEGGAGVSETDIGPPDLATRFEFHLIVGGGLQWFYRDNLAATLHYRLGHLSNANIKGPNIGLNENVLLLGVTWFL